MNEELVAIRAVCFGVFELDLRAQELRKDGLRLKLEGKPLQVLKLLVERAGELVTRKELRERLWPDSFVEFDRNINTAVNRLRKTLGDTTENPRYIETRSRLGYRFVAPIGAADVTARSGPWGVPLDAKPAGRPSLIGFNAKATSPTAPFIATANPSFEGDALRFQAHLVLRFTTTKEGALNMRLDFCGARSEEGRRVPGRSQFGPNSSHQSGHSESSLGRARR